jgi:2-oxoglutarate ferredoxin oxidoreductase subunit delta
MMNQVHIDVEACKGFEDCGICSFACPESLFVSSGRMNGFGFVVPEVLDPEKCTGCCNCMILCPDMAIVVQREETRDAG